MIVCRDVGVRFENDRHALSNINVEFEKGTITALVGASGSGKTTLLRVIAGLQVATSGEVHRRSPDAKLAFVFQRPNLLPWLTALENVRLPLDLQEGKGFDKNRGHKNKSQSSKSHQSAKSRRHNDEIAAAALADVDLEGSESLFPRQLSGGMQMRVSMARALINQPQILLLDEPFAALDEMLREQLGCLLLKLWDQHRFTVVLVTHHIGESAWLSQRVVILKEGHITDRIENPSPWPRPLPDPKEPIYAETCSKIIASLRQPIAPQPAMEME